MQGLPTYVFVILFELLQKLDLSASRELGIMTDLQIFATSLTYSANLNAYAVRWIREI